MKILSLILLLGFFTAQGAEPAAIEQPTKEALKDVAEIPVLFNGRVMPLDSFARLHLLQFSGRKSFNGESAMAWMGRLLFAPETTENDAVFLINHPELLDAMDVERTQVIEGKRKPSTRRFSYLHLEPGISQLMEIARRAQQMQSEDNEALKGKEFLVEREALRVYHNILTYRALSQVFAYSRELPGLVIDHPEVREALQLEEGDTTFTYLDLRSRVGGLTPLMEQAHKLGGPETWNAPQQDAMTLAQLMYSFHVTLSELPLTLLPEAPHGESIWIAPMDALHSRDGDKALIHAGERAGLLAQAWVKQDWSAVSEESKALTEFSRSRMDHVRETRLTGKEAAYNRANYFGRAKIFYIFAFFLSFGALLSGGNKLRWAAWLPMLIAFGFHVSGIAWRIYLTARPPVTNLYGTFLFVGLICLLLAILVEFFQKNGLGIFAGSFIALTFLFIADRFAAEGDTMHKVVAVLASNFWLSTHVLAVTTGYAGVWIAGVFGHIWLVLKLLGKDKATLEKVRLPLEGLLGFGLTFAFLGTMLGGVWADQSWGRFWGWDPKENGALLIVLWTAVIYHARVAGLIREIGLAVGSIIGCIMVMVAWLGVNLLGVGLHSYGFTTAMARGFYGYIIAESVFIVVMLLGLKIFQNESK
ncbi:cytochrome c biogenesis protein CcsA [Kiritimatiellaeota bacterium B1221]|nr:cytochrome c biogenesis protein CcsA [Kiritimatiellaeota bacterium B1221]